MKASDPKLSVKGIAQRLGIPTTTLFSILKNENILKERSKCNPFRKRRREGKNPEIENALLKWFSIMTAQSVRVSRPMLVAKANEFARKFGCRDFEVTRGWYYRWKKRNNIIFRDGSEIFGSCDAPSGIVDNMSEEDEIEAAVGGVLKEVEEEAPFQSDDIQSHLLQTLLQGSDASAHAN